MKKNVIFLGDRLIAQKCLTLLVEDKYREAFEVESIVSSKDFFDSARINLGLKSSVDFVSNEERSENRILDSIESNKIDMLISVQHNWILTEPILNAVSFQCFNLHNAKLPDYKGYNSISHAIINGDNEYVSTLHWMSPKVDSGDIAYQGISCIEKYDTAESLYKKTVEASTSIFKNFLDDLLSKKPIPRLPIKGNGKFYRKNDLDDLKQINDIINFEKVDLISRAVFFPPHEPASLTFGGSKFFLIPESEKKSLFTNKNAAYKCSW